jgi:hypothetical protein
MAGQKRDFVSELKLNSARKMCKIELRRSWVSICQRCSCQWWVGTNLTGSAYYWCSSLDRPKEIPDLIRSNWRPQAIVFRGSYRM